MRDKAAATHRQDSDTYSDNTDKDAAATDNSVTTIH